jgi:CelD/BcsL family acetyltransferase involved in cellulose biosynthesis
MRAEVLPPSALGRSEIQLWHNILEASPHLQRAFFTPAFALACERAIGRAYVAVLHANGTVRGFLPFQFRSRWHQTIRMADRIGGNLSDNAGLVAWPDVRTDSSSLLRLCGLASLTLSHLMPDQGRFGLDAEWTDIGYVTDLSDGPDAYFAGLLARNKDFVRDTERRLRKTQKDYGPLSMRDEGPVTPDAIAGLVALKRQQYQRTQVADAFAEPTTLRIIDALRDSPTADCELVLAALHAGDAMLAAHLGLQHNGVLSWWFPVYDPAAQGVSPGRLLLWRMIQRAQESGTRLIDYGAGDAQYKRQFSTENLQMGRAVWTAGNARSLLARAWQSLEWRITRRSTAKAKQN